MPQISSSFTHREVLRALRKAGWEKYLPQEDELENADDICIEFTAEVDLPQNESHVS